MPNTTYTAPVGSIDIAADGYVIWPCPLCRPWHIEVITDPDGGVVAREWHAVDCRAFQWLISAFGNRQRLCEKEAGQ